MSLQQWHLALLIDACPEPSTFNSTLLITNIPKYTEVTDFDAMVAIELQGSITLYIITK